MTLRGAEEFYRVSMAEVSEVTLRLANIEDSALLLAWRNDQETREHSISTQKINKFEHDKWLRDSLEDASIKLFIVVSAGKSVGTVRAQKGSTGWILSWTVSPKSRGKNIGYRAVAILVKQLCGNVLAYIKANNLASIRIAEKLGMVCKSKNEETTLWVLSRE